jgi:hypothetical protein
MRPVAAQDPAGGGGSRCGLRSPSPGCGLILLLHGEVATFPKLWPPARIYGDTGFCFFSFVGPAGQQHEDVRRQAFVFFIFMKMIAVRDLHVPHGKRQ